MSALPDPPETEYDTDFYAWTQVQAERLRALQVAGRFPAELDVENIAEEIESLGRSDLHAVEAALRNLFIHLLKIASAPDARSVHHWKIEALNFSFEASQKYAPSMRRKLAVQKMWDGARRLARAQLAEYNGELTDGLPDECPFTIDELSTGDFDVEVFVARLSDRDRDETPA